MYKVSICIGVSDMGYKKEVGQCVAWLWSKNTETYDWNLTERLGVQ